MHDLGVRQALKLFAKLWTVLTVMWLVLWHCYPAPCLVFSIKISCAPLPTNISCHTECHLYWSSIEKRELQMLLCSKSLVVTLRTPHMVLFTSCIRHTKWPKDNYICKGVSMLIMIKHHFMMWWWCQPKWWFDELTTNQGGSEAMLYIFSPLDHLWVLPLPLRKLLIVSNAIMSKKNISETSLLLFGH